MSFNDCLSGLPKINWARVNRENAQYAAESYWCVVHYETNREWRHGYPHDITKYWDKTHPIRGMYNAERRMNWLRTGDKGLWKIREVSPYELEHDCRAGKDDYGNDSYAFNDLKFPA